MKTADSRSRLDAARFGRTSFDGSLGRRGLVQADVCAVFVIIGQILMTKPAEMALVERDDVIDHLTANTADPSLPNAVLLGNHPRPANDNQLKTGQRAS